MIKAGKDKTAISKSVFLERVPIQNVRAFSRAKPRTLLLKML
jgi:hypothetical protein